MNATVLLALIAAVAALVLLTRVLMYVMMRRAGRAALVEVGKRAVNKLPEYILLTQVESPRWTNLDLVRKQAEPLLHRGFEDAGVYSVNRMPGVLIRMMCQPQTSVAAHVYDHPRSGSWTEMVTRYIDGGTQSVSTLAPNGMNHPDWFRKLQADKAMPTDRIYDRFLKSRRADAVKPVATTEIVREFEQVYYRLALWRREAGISPEEVAHVAVKWIHEKKADAATTFGN